MKPKNCLIFGGSGQIGRHLIRKLTKNNIRVTVVTRNIHQKSYIIKTQGNAGYINIVEANIYEEKKIRALFEKTDLCINLVGILYENKKANTFYNIHTLFPSLLAKLAKEYNMRPTVFNVLMNIPGSRRKVEKWLASRPNIRFATSYGGKECRIDPWYKREPETSNYWIRLSVGYETNFKDIIKDLEDFSL